MKYVFIEGIRMKNILALILFMSTSALTAQDWQMDFNQAKELANQSNKKIVLVFQGSDWCAPCIKLDREILSSEEFKTYASQNYVMVQADFPRKKQNKLSSQQQEKNNKLAEKYNRQGVFPFVLVLDKNGKVLGYTSYKKISPSAFIILLESFSS